MLEDDATGTSTLRTEDDTDFDAGYGGCETYSEGGGNHYYCDKDIQDNRCSNAPETCTCIGYEPFYDDVCSDLSSENCTTNENCRIDGDNYCYVIVDPARCTFAMEACPVACRICANPPFSITADDLLTLSQIEHICPIEFNICMENALCSVELADGTASIEDDIHLSQHGSDSYINLRNCFRQAVELDMGADVGGDR